MTEKYETLSIEKKIGQLFMIGIPGPEVDAATRELLDEVSPGGICLFARNIREAGQTRELADGLRAFLPTQPIIAIDQEGGLVDRLRRVLSPMPAADRIGTAEGSRWLATVVSEALLMVGVNMDFAPVVDIIDADRKGHINGLTSRTFGSTKEETTALAGEFLRTLQSKGVLGCLKHFPGLGASTVDSHEELPLVKISQAELYSTDLYPYRQLIASGDAHSIMIGHAAYPSTILQESDQNGRLLPSSLSGKIVTGLLRDELGFDGLIVTDDLEMGAIIRNYGIGDACVKAITAGVDMLAICADPNAIRNGYRAVRNAVEDGQIERDRIERSVGRISEFKAMTAAPLTFDLDRFSGLAGEIATFTAGVSK